MLQCGVTGAVPYGSVGPKMASIGRPTAAATCIAPESLPMKRWHCDSSAGRSAIPVFPVRSIGGRLISAAIAAETVASAAVPKRITSAPVSLCKRFATSAKREGGQHFADPYEDRKSTRLNSSHRCISYAVFCLKKKKKTKKKKETK